MGKKATQKAMNSSKVVMKQLQTFHSSVWYKIYFNFFNLEALSFMLVVDRGNILYNAFLDVPKCWAKLTILESFKSYKHLSIQ